MAKSRHFPNRRRNPEVDEDILMTLAETLGIDVKNISAYRSETINEKIDRLTLYAEEQATKKTGSDRGRRLTGSSKERWWRNQVDRWIEEALEEKNESDLLAALLTAQRRGIKGRITKDKTYGGIDVEYMKENGAFSGTAHTAAVLFKLAAKQPEADDVNTEIAYLNFMPQFFNALQNAVEQDDFSVYVPQTFLEANARVVKYTLSPAVNVTTEYLKTLMATPTAKFQTALAKACGMDPSYLAGFQKGEYTMKECLVEGADEAKENRRVRFAVLRGQGTVLAGDNTLDAIDETKDPDDYLILKDTDAALKYKNSLIFRTFMGLTGLPDAFRQTSESSLFDALRSELLLAGTPSEELFYYSLTPPIMKIKGGSIYVPIDLDGPNNVIPLSNLKPLLGNSPEDTGPETTANYFATKARAAKKAVSEALEKIQNKVIKGREDGQTEYLKPGYGLYSKPNLSYFDEVEKYASVIGKVVGGEGMVNAAARVILKAVGSSSAKMPPELREMPELVKHLYSQDSIETTEKLYWYERNFFDFVRNTSIADALRILTYHFNHEFLLEGYTPYANGAYKPEDIQKVAEAAQAMGQAKLLSGPSTASFVGSGYLEALDYLNTLSAEVDLLKDNPDIYAYGGVDPYATDDWLSRSQRSSTGFLPSNRVRYSGNTEILTPARIRKRQLKNIVSGFSEGIAAVLTQAPIAEEIYPQLGSSELLCAVSPTVAAQTIFHRIGGCFASKRYDAAQTAFFNDIRRKLDGQYEASDAIDAQVSLMLVKSLADLDTHEQGDTAEKTARTTIIHTPKLLNKFATPMLPKDNAQGVNSYWDSHPYTERNGFRLAVGNEPELYTYDKEYGYAIDVFEYERNKEYYDSRSWANKPALKVVAPQPFQDWTWIDQGAGERRGRYGVTKLDYDKDPPGRVGPDLPKGGVKELNQTGVTKIGFGEWVDKDITYKTFHIRGLFAGLFDMADFLGVSFKRMGRLLATPTVAMGAPYEDGGQNLWLKFGIGQRGRPGASAHYEAEGSEPNTINMTKINGPGSLFHEMIHYIDFMLYKAMDRSNPDMRYLSEPTWSGSKSSKYCLSNQWSVSYWRFPAGKRISETIEIEGTGDKVSLYYAQTDDESDEARAFKQKYGEFPLALSSRNAEKTIHLAFYEEDASATGGYRTVGYTSQTDLQKALGDSLLFSFAMLMRAIYGNTEPEVRYVKDPYYHNEFTFMSAHLGVGYWASPLEMLARSAESYAADWFTERERNSSYLVERARTKSPYGVKLINGKPQLIFGYPQDTYSNKVLVAAHPTDPSKHKYETFTSSPYDRTKIKVNYEIFFKYLKLYINAQYCDESPFDIGLDVEELGPDAALQAEIGDDPALEEAEEKGTKLVEKEDITPDDTGEGV